VIIDKYADIVDVQAGRNALRVTGERERSYDRLLKKRRISITAKRNQNTSNSSLLRAGKMNLISSSSLTFARRDALGEKRKYQVTVFVGHTG
jgi:hypothetical protein